MMDFSYTKLGRELEKARKKRNLTQSDLEELSNYRLKQSAISSAENGKTRLSVDTFIDFCNLLQVRPEDLLDDFLTIPPLSEQSNAIVDSNVIRVADIMNDCPPDMKRLMLKICECIHDQMEM